MGKKKNRQKFRIEEKAAILRRHRVIGSAESLRARPMAAWMRYATTLEQLTLQY